MMMPIYKEAIDSTKFPKSGRHILGLTFHDSRAAPTSRSPYMGEDRIVFGSDSLWYGGPQWQIDALWRFQIPDQIQDKWKYPSLDYRAKRKILGLNSARLYDLDGSATRPVGAYGSPYKQGSLADYASYMQPGSSIDDVLQGVGYPEPIMPASLLPNDNFTRMKKQYAEMGLGRSNTRFGWMRARGWRLRGDRPASTAAELVDSASGGPGRAAHLVTPLTRASTIWPTRG